jgi:hypothetical protein
MENNPNSWGAPTPTDYLEQQPAPQQTRPVMGIPNYNYSQQPQIQQHIQSFLDPDQDQGYFDEGSQDQGYLDEFNKKDYGMSTGLKGWVAKKMLCFLVGFAILAIFLLFLSAIPFFGPPIKYAVSWLLTKLLQLFGIANCGFEDMELDNVIKTKV